MVTMAEQESDNGRRRIPRLSPDQIVERARRVLNDLGGMDVERVTSVQPDDDGKGWRVQLEVLAVHRVPETADVLARYEVSLSRGGQFRGYREVGRRRRADVEEMQ
jgi:hypothetical protein